MASFLVTGGAGFIGSHIVERLVGEGEAVRVLDDLSTGRMENIAPFLDKIEFIRGSLTDPDVCLRACDGVDFVLHQGAIPSVPRSVDDPVRSHEANVTGTVNLLNAARRCKVRRVVYAASSSAYGNQAVQPKSEDQRPAPLSPYAVSKLAGEHYCAAWWHCYGLETISLRYFNVFGPRQNPRSQYAAVIPRFIAALLHGEPPPVHGDGLQSRDFTFVANNVHANLLAVRAKQTRGEVVNIACGTSFTLLDLIAALNDILGVNVAPRFLPPRPGDVKHSLAALEAARALIGYEPIVGFKEGLQRTVEWFKAHPEEL
ncbi:MAG: SDR family oxidoreductase [Candidatus Sumerlaeia bacterium]